MNCNRAELSIVLYQADTDMLFPVRVIPSLSGLRGDSWQRLVERVREQPETAPDVLAFSLMMIRLNACINCAADSYRAMQGCTHCALHTVARFKGDDHELVARWQAARQEILDYLNRGKLPAG